MGAANAWRGALSDIGGLGMNYGMNQQQGGGGTSNLSSLIGSPEDYVGMGASSGAPPSWVTAD